MLNRRQGMAVGVAILLVVLAASPSVVGAVAMKRLRAQVEGTHALGSVPVQVRVESYAGGWRNAEALTRWHFPLQGVSLLMRHRITHGPDPGFGWLRVETAPLVSPMVEALLRPYFEGDPISAVTHVTWSGGWTTVLDSPPFDKPLHLAPGAGNVVWGGLDGRFSGRGTAMAGTVSMPAGAVTGPGFLARFSGISSEIDLDVVWPTVALEGTGNYRLETLSVSRNGMRLLSLDGVESDFEQTRRADDRMVSRGNLAVRALEANGPLASFRISDLSARVSGGIARDALIRFQDGLRRLPETALATPDGLPSLALESATGYLNGSPDIALESFHVNTADGPLDGTLRMAVDGDGLVLDQRSLADPGPLAQRVTLDVDVTLTEPMLMALVRLLTADAARAEAMKHPRGHPREAADRVARRWIEGALATGYVTWVEGRYRIYGGFADGVASVGGVARGSVPDDLARMLDAT